MSKIINQKTYKFELPAGKTKERLDIFLTNSIENATRSRVQKLIDTKFVWVNRRYVKSNYLVKAGDIVEAIIPISPRPEKAEPENIPLDIIYEDDFLIVVNKPAGMVAHPAYSNYTGTLVNALLHHTSQLSETREPIRPGIVHRIDKDTSGLLVVAKDDVTHQKLALQFFKHTAEREYHAICWGKMDEPEGVFDTLITRSKQDRKKFAVSRIEGKQAVTLYYVIEEFEFASYLKLRLRTGRTHQIRVHLSSSNHPIFGDATYGGDKIHFGADQPKMKSRIQNLLEIMPRQALHAKTLGFLHPHTNQFMKFDSELPDDMKKLLEKLKM